MIGPRKASDLPADHRLSIRPVDEKRELPIPVVSVHVPEAAAYDSPENIIVSLSNPDSFVKWDAIYAPAVYTLGASKCCALCGLPFDGFPAFLGGPSTIRTGLYNDGPMHLECAVASLTLCPHLRMGNHRRSSESRQEGITERSERMFLVIVSGYSISLGSDSMRFEVSRDQMLAAREFHYVNGEIEEVT